MSHQTHLPSPAPSPFPGAAGAGTAPDPDTVRTELEAQLLRLSQDLYEMEVCAGEVAPGMEDAVPNYLAKINKALIDLSALAPHVTDSVPRAVVENVDRYKNPHQYTKTTLSRAVGENQHGLGRQLGLESFRRQLHSAIADSFPSVPLPERRHVPVGGEDMTDEGEGQPEKEAGVGAVVGEGDGDRDGGRSEGVDVPAGAGVSGLAGAAGASTAGDAPVPVGANADVEMETSAEAQPPSINGAPETAAGATLEPEPSYPSLGLDAPPPPPPAQGAPGSSDGAGTEGAAVNGQVNGDSGAHE